MQASTSHNFKISCRGQELVVFFKPPKMHKLAPKKKQPPEFSYPGGGRKWDQSRSNALFSSFPYQIRVFEVDKSLTRAASAASSAPLGGSGGELAEKLLGKTQKQTTRKIAGINQDEIEDPTLIADPDSCFCEFNGVMLHHKICDAGLSNSDTFRGSSSRSLGISKMYNFPSILLHGFGASVFSWNKVMKPLATVTGSKVLAFDRPAFGLTSRANAVKHPSQNQDTKPLNPYSTEFSVLATLYFIGFLAAEKVILVGHSAGALIAVDAYFEAPEHVAALILVAPAILAPFMPNSQKQSKDGGDNQSPGNSPGLNTGRNLFLRFYDILSKFSAYIAEVIMRMIKGMAGLINALYKQALSTILRSAFGLMVLRMIIDKFGTAAVRSAWYDPNLVTDHDLQGYTKPLKVKGWDKALAEYTVALLTDPASKLKPPPAKRLMDISCPVLIVTGDSDRLVPSWNSERLSRAIPGSHFELIKNCGHLPQEEKAEEFVSVVDKFLQSVFGTAEEPQLQAAT